MKTKETILLEQALDEQSQQKREYGCQEVTIGFKKDGLGNEVVDYMTLDANDICKCYEIKVTLQDLKTDNKKSFYGEYNYLVVSNSLYVKQPVWDNYIPPFCGILVGKELKVKRQAKRKTVTKETKDMLKDSLLRSVFWKYENYKNAANLDNYKALQKQLEDLQNQYSQSKQENERMIWTYNDYEYWYRKNHQDTSFTIEQQAKEERRQSLLREKGQYTWIERDHVHICPCCEKQAIDEVLSPYCPYCGAYLKR